ncbi:uncharacterized protein LOC135205785 isoform X1 [Macrobrachium nipponense]|uniref:uncharacterized protein LOC135205785 isoform X1 n=1 Tax=Macrobrachium nipponense TaxID=159736 RepID=UPI0030C7CAF4
MGDSLDPSKLKVAELRAELQARGLDTKGNKPVLVERLKEALEQANDEEEADAGDFELEPDHDEQDEEEDEEDPDAPDPDSAHENEPILELEPEREFEHEAEHDEPPLELEPEGDLDAESEPEPEPEPEHRSEPESRAKSTSPPREDEPSQKGTSSYSSPHKDDDSSEEKDFDSSHRQHSRDNTTAKGDDIAVKEEVDEYYKTGYEDAPMQDMSVKEELGNGYEGSMKIEEIDVKEELLEPKQELSDTEDRRGEKRRAHSRSRSPDSKKQRPEVEEVRVEDEPEFDKSAVLLDWWMVARNTNIAGDTARITSQARKMVLNVHHYFRSLNQLECEANLQKKTAAATGVSVQTVEKILNYPEDGRLESPPPRKKHSPITGNIEGIEEESIRRVILSFYECAELPTLECLFERVKEPPFKFTGVKSTLARLVKNLGFCYKTIQGGRTILIEKNDIVAERSKYCRIMFANRTSSHPRPEIYVGETFISLNEFFGSQKQSNSKEQLVVVHAGGEYGFIHGALQVLQIKSGSREDLESLNYHKFRNWFQGKLLSNIPPHSLIVMDSCSYHSKFLNKAPTSSSKKSEIIEWLTQSNIVHDSLLTRSELLQLVALHKGKQVYEIDEIALNRGHSVLRIPHFHKLLNPIELVWAHVKSVARKADLSHQRCLKEVGVSPASVVDRIYRNVMNIITAVTKDDWRKFIGYVRDMEEDYRNKDRAVESMLEQTVYLGDDKKL